MSIINLIKTSIYSLKFRKLRVFLTMIGIIIGISSVVTILSIGDGLKKEVLKSSEDTSANKINVSFTPENPETDMNLIEPFTESDIYNLRNIDGVQKVEASKHSMGGMSVFTCDLSYFDKSSFGALDTFEDKAIDIQYGRSFSKGEEDNNYIVLDIDVAKTLFDDPKKAIGHGININRENFEVIGVQKEPSALSLLGGYNYISKQAKESMTSSDTINSIDVYIEPNKNGEEVFKDIDKELKLVHNNIQGKYELQDPQQITKVFESIIGGLTKFIALVTGISLFVGGIGVMNIMYVSVSERKREIGIRRAIGAKPRSILLQFLLEAIIVTGIGGLIGILCGYLFAKLAGAFLPFPPVLSVGSFIGATLTSVIVGVIFGIIPAINASKLDPIKAIYK